MSTVVTSREDHHQTSHIHIVEDDFALANAMQLLIQTEGLKTIYHASGEDFLFNLAQHTPPTAEIVPSCILLDIRLIDMSGLEVFDEITSMYPDLTAPIIFLTGHGDLHMAVEVMKKGAFDFLTKPFNSERLLQQVHKALKKSTKLIEEYAFQQEIVLLLESLTDREKLVMNYVVEGLHNKEIAELLGNSVRTIEIHRANVYNKMKVKSAVDLGRLMERYAQSQ